MNLYAIEVIASVVFWERLTNRLLTNSTLFWLKLSRFIYPLILGVSIEYFSFPLWLPVIFTSSSGYHWLLMKEEFIKKISQKPKELCCCGQHTYFLRVKGWEVEIQGLVNILNNVVLYDLIGGFFHWLPRGWKGLTVRKLFLCLFFNFPFHIFQSSFLISIPLWATLSDFSF